MTILVTGGAGYIGSHTCVQLLENGYDIVVADNLCNSRAEALERIKSITGKGFPFYKIDLRDEDSLQRLFSEHKIDCVIHFAGLKAVGESVSIPLTYYDNNINSTLSLCRLMEKNNVKKIIFSSSATVYSSDNPMPVDENAATGSTNPYGWTKYMCEQILRDMTKASPGWSAVLLRYFNPVGAHESGLIGEDPEGIPNNLVPFITQTAIGRIDRLSIYGNDYATEDGTGVRDYIHVVDLARGHVAAIEYCLSHEGTEAFNLGTGRGTSVLQMVEAFERVIGKKIPSRIVDRRPGDNAVCYAVTEKAGQMLGWNAEKTINDMCSDAWRWQSKNPMGYL